MTTIKPQKKRENLENQLNFRTELSTVIYFHRHYADAVDEIEQNENATHALNYHSETIQTIYD